MILLKTNDQIQRIRESGAILYHAMHKVGRALEAGMSTFDIDALLYEEITAHQNALPAFLHYEGFPASACISINEEVIHGIPDKKRRIRNGDLVSIDLGVNLNGGISDSAFTFAVGKIKPEEQRLLSVTQSALAAGIEAAVAGNRVKDISQAVYRSCRGYGVVYDYCGHGVGIEVHEDPQIPNVVYSWGSNPRLKPGMVIAIEPMVNLGTADVSTLSNGWTVVTDDGQKSAHFEHTVAITENGPLILTDGTC